VFAASLAIACLRAASSMPTIRCPNRKGFYDLADAQ
jgi:hypothetical protein